MVVCFVVYPVNAVGEISTKRKSEHYRLVTHYLFKKRFNYFGSERHFLVLKRARRAHKKSEEK